MCIYELTHIYIYIYNIHVDIKKYIQTHTYKVVFESGFAAVLLTSTSRIRKQTFELLKTLA